ncbi:MAG: hypothetical protein EOP84_36135 [Verrucomicrobiaceae bacterium]|nr:MAG: hypothetical protein EOP84_36135 [Verrucomicrobiaceae bacterium]
MQPTEIQIRGRKYTLSREVLVLALMHAGRDVERTRRGLVRLVEAYDRYLQHKAHSRKRVGKQLKK